jgi:hypothetical protein
MKSLYPVYKIELFSLLLAHHGSVFFYILTPKCKLRVQLEFLHDAVFTEVKKHIMSDGNNSGCICRL